jgi:hypothetical protein
LKKGGGREERERREGKKKRGKEEEREGRKGEARRNNVSHSAALRCTPRCPASSCIALLNCSTY